MFLTSFAHVHAFETLNNLVRINLFVSVLLNEREVKNLHGVQETF